jgi:hypothetical protein
VVFNSAEVIAMKLHALLGSVFVPAIVAAQQSGYVSVSDGARLFY